MEVLYKNRPVEVTGTIMVGEGFEIDEAFFLDGDKEELSSEECEELQEEAQDTLYQEAYENFASVAYDRAKDAWKYGE